MNYPQQIAIAILNWNGVEFLKKFLPSVIKNSDEKISNIYIIDNGSTDNSITVLQEHFPTIKIILLDKNYGFAEGYNRGLKKIEAKYYLLLNSDVEVPENWLKPLYELMESDENIAVCGPKLLDFEKRDTFEYSGAVGGFIDKYAYPFCRGRIFGNIEKDNQQYDSPLECFWVGGAAFLIRSELYNLLGGFDEIFFAHQEEIDLCWRLKNLGYKIICEPKSIVYHVGGGTLNKTNPHKTFLNFRNNLFLIYKNLPKFQRRKVLFARFYLDIIAALQMIFQGHFKDAKAVVKSYFDFWKQKKNLKYFNRKLNIKYHRGYYKKSIVFLNFIKKVNKFSELT
ncbi:MAG: glycosyltransferase family 2 protein [Bacteroidales bacterium]|jgi:GT2 family glycosyltransferase|nr:glycosyltransferase family 2 protein [Bacteroidales bacterium]